MDTEDNRRTSWSRGSSGSMRAPRLPPSFDYDALLDRHAAEQVARSAAGSALLAAPRVRWSSRWSARVSGDSTSRSMARSW